MLMQYHAKFLMRSFGKADKALAIPASFGGKPWFPGDFQLAQFGRPSSEQPHRTPPVTERSDAHDPLALSGALILWRPLRS